MLLIGRNPVAQDFIVAYSIMVFTAAIARVSFDGVNNAVFNPLNDSSMIGFSILRTGAAFVVPIEEDNHTGCRFDIVICPLATILEPIDAVDAACVFGNDASLDIPALISAPRYKTGAPFYARSETVPAPVGFTAYIIKLNDRMLVIEVLAGIIAKVVEHRFVLHVMPVDDVVIALSHHAVLVNIRNAVIAVLLLKAVLQIVVRIKVLDDLFI